MHIKVEHIENEIDSLSVQCACNNNNAAEAHNTARYDAKSIKFIIVAYKLFIKCGNNMLAHTHRLSNAKRAKIIK